MDTCIELSESEYSSAWDNFFAEYSFNPSVNTFPGIIEPSPSVTFSISDLWMGEANDELVDDLYKKAGQIFQKTISDGDYLLALDWQHTCYRFYPHKVNSRDDLGQLGCVGFVPDGDYCIFLSRDFEIGWFGHPWEQTICIFGQHLINTVNELKPKLFDKVLRIDGRAV